MSEKNLREKVLEGLTNCSQGILCGHDCPYREEQLKEDGCYAALARDALNLLGGADRGYTVPAQIVPRELLLHTWGHGWQESHVIGDDEDPESFDLAECVWINGHIMDEDGSDANAASDYWAENYGKKYGIRIWTGDEKPTDKQREETPWTE